jgi:hypothetical protein
MTLRIILLIIFCSTILNLLAQTKNKFVIAETIDKKDYFYIPKTALADTVKAILYQDKVNKKINPNKRPIEFYWISTCNDGYYNLTITPQQIFFSSSHDNPNPNFLYWVIDIDSLQYKQIKKGLEQKPPYGFENLSKNYRQSLTVFYDKKYKDTFSIPEKWTDTIVQHRDLYCKAQIKAQLDRYSSIVNSYIIDTKMKVQFPTDEQAEKMRPKYFSFFKQELYDWVPVKFDPPKSSKDK